MSGNKQIGSKVYLVGYESQKISGCKLPTNRQVLGVFFNKHRSLKLEVNKSAWEVSNEVTEFWMGAGIPVLSVRQVGRKIRNLYSEWMKLHKNKNRKSSVQKTKEKQFHTKLDKLFDVAARNVVDSLSPTSNDFLQSQRKKERRGVISLGSRETTAIQPGHSEMLQENCKRDDVDEAGNNTLL